MKKLLAVASLVLAASTAMVGCSSDYKTLSSGDVVSLNPQKNDGLDMVKYHETYTAQGGEAYVTKGRLNRNADLNVFVNKDTLAEGTPFATFHKADDLAELPDGASAVPANGTQGVTVPAQDLSTDAGK